MSEQTEFENLLRAYAAPIADNGFTEATLAREKAQAKWRLPILLSAGLIGGILAMIQMPALWQMLSALEIPPISFLVRTALGVFGLVGWGALDRGWSDTV